MDALDVISVVLLIVMIGMGICANAGIAHVIRTHPTKTALGAIFGWLVVADMSALVVKGVAGTLMVVHGKGQLFHSSCLAADMTSLVFHGCLMATLAVLVGDRLLVLRSWVFYKRRITSHIINQIVCLIWISMGGVVLILWGAGVVEGGSCKQALAMSAALSNNSLSHNASWPTKHSDDSHGHVFYMQRLQVFQIIVAVVLLLASLFILWTLRNAYTLRQGLCSDPAVFSCLKERPPPTHRRGAQAVAISTITYSLIVIFEATLMLIALSRNVSELVTGTSALIGPLGHVVRPVIVIYLSASFRRTLAGLFKRRSRRVRVASPKFTTNFNIEHCLQVDAAHFSVPWYLQPGSTAKSVSQSLHLSVISELSEIGYDDDENTGTMRRRLSIVSILSVGSCSELGGPEGALPLEGGVLAGASLSSSTSSFSLPADQDLRTRRAVKLSIGSVQSFTDDKGMLSPNVHRKRLFTIPAIAFASPNPLPKIEPRRKSNIH